MDDIGRLRARRGIKQALLALGFTVAFGTGLSLSTILPAFDPQREAFLKYGLVVSVVVACYSSLLAAGLVRNPALALARLTPLRPALYYGHTLWRVAPSLFAFTVLVPAVFLTCFYLSSQAKVFRGGPFPLNLVLTYYVSFLLPFHEQLSAHTWSYLFFFPRKILRLLLRKVLSSGWAIVLAGLAAAAVCVWWEPWRAFVKGMDTLLGLGVWGRIVYYLAVPFAGVFHLHEPGVPVSVQWGLTAALAAAAVLMIRTVARQWTLSPQEWDKAVFEEWVGVREEFEDTESRIEEARESRKRFIFTNIYGDGFLTAEQQGPPPAAPQRRSMEYTPSLEPEETLVRHARFWFGHSKGLPAFWAGFIALGWVCLAVLHQDSWTTAPARDTLKVLVAPVFVWLASVGFLARAGSVAWLPAIPLRWPSLMRADYLFRNPYVIVMDCLAAALITTAAFPHPAFFPVSLAVILVSRFNAYMHAWLLTARGAGHRLGYWIQLAVGGVSWAALMPVCMIFAALDTSPLAQRKLTVMLFVLVWKGGLFAVSVGCVLAEWLRSGPQVAGPRFADAELPTVPANTGEASGESLADN